MTGQKTNEVTEEDFPNSIVCSYEIMQERGRWLESGTIVLKNGETFSYKIRRLKDKKMTKGEKC